MTVLTVVELIWWGLAWRAGAAPEPFVLTYLLLTSLGLGTALALRFVLRLGSPEAGWHAIVAGTLLVAVGASMFLPLKYAIPTEIPFWLDQPLAAAERSAFGRDPWILLDSVLGWATKPIDVIYGCWLPTQLLVMFLVMLSRPSEAKAQALIAYSLAWFLLGAVAAVLLSSAGPLFYDRAFGGSRFAALAANLRSHGARFALTESDRMWAATRTDRPGLIAGISAMPSIHVAVSFWIVLTARLMRPRLMLPAIAYFMVIWVGSVQLGWHYVSDGVAGTLGMIGVWGVARLLAEGDAIPVSSTKRREPSIGRSGRQRHAHQGDCRSKGR